MSAILPATIDDIDLDQLFQVAAANITGLPGKLVFDRFPTDPDQIPRRPEPTTNWAVIGVTVSESDDTPVITAHPTDRTLVNFTDHEQLEVLASFYGPNSQRFANLFRDGIKIPQNMEDLSANGIKLQNASRVLRVPSLISQQWQNRRDLHLTFKRRIDRVYPIDRFDVVQIHIFDDHPANKTVFDRTLSIDFTKPPPNT